uniref:Gastrin-releasing peptide n=1 Tax=Knipowitschia caucasica TaxID=637954 RepID=A0AAV2IXL3_KNICA
MYPRGNHWAVGHLMGKKSVKGAASLQRADYEHDVIRASRTEEAAPRLQRRTHTLQPLRSRWRRENLYLREIIDLLLMALKLQENGSI